MTQNNFGGASYRYVFTPQMADIYAAQTLYGASTVRATNTTYGFNVAGLSGLTAQLYNFANFTQAPSLTIVDSDGIDTLDVSGYSQNQIIDLNGGTWSNIGGLVGNIGIYYTTVIEIASGGSGNDTITGNAVGNVLNGNGGNDTIFGGAGGDLLTGGAGNDSLVGGSEVDAALYATARAGFIVRTIGAGAGTYVTQVSDSSGALGVDAVTQVELLQFNGLLFGNYGMQSNRIANFDGGFYDDVALWNSTTGQNIYANQAGGLNSAGYSNIINPSVWRGVGSGDYNADGRADLMVQNTLNGQIWFYNNSGIGSAWTTVVASAGFTFIDSGDATGDGDGIVDLLFQYGGANYIYDLNTTTGVGTWIGAGTFAGWNTIGLADCNRDGRSDMLIQEAATGTTYFRDINTGVFGVVTTGVGSTWACRGAGDLNGDGFSDVIFQNTSNGNVWYVNMMSLTWGVVANGLVGWNVEGTADVDNDGYRDVVIRNATSGDIYSVNMDNGVFNGFGIVASGIGTSWLVV
jgi:hypothetical protein